MGGYSELLFGFNSGSPMARIPRQKRAIATADAIVDAGFIAVARVGVSGTTTNLIAEIAGIGVGSLYEYYANKEAVYAAMQQRMVNDAVALVAPLINELVQMDMEEAVRLLLHRFEQFLLENDGRYLKYAQNALNVNPVMPLDPLTNVLRELVMRYLMGHPDLLRMPGIPAMSYIMINGGIFIVLRHLSDPNPPVTFAELSDGLVGMVRGFTDNALARVEKRG